MSAAAWGFVGIVVGWAASEIVVALIRTRHRFYQAYLRTRKRTRVQ